MSWRDANIEWVSYIEDTVGERLRERDCRRRGVVRSVRGWLRAERYPRLTIAILLSVCGVIATGFGCMLAHWGVKAWGERAFWSVLAVWPVFVLLVRWRAAVEFEEFPVGDGARSFVATDDLAEQRLLSEEVEPAWKRTCRESIARESGRACGNFLGLLLIGGLTLGTWLAWLLIAHGATLLAETIVDAELVPAKPQLICSFQHLDWRTEAFGFTAIHFIGIALGAGAVGCALAYLPGAQ